jgi:excisionase family DNA binding protein
MTVAEAAVHATVSEALIRQWVREGTLPHFRLGAKGRRGKIMIRVEDLDGVLANFKVERKAPEPVKAPVPRQSAFKHLRLS